MLALVLKAGADADAGAGRSRQLALVPAPFARPVTPVRDAVRNDATATPILGTAWYRQCNHEMVIRG
jgi:hypothetical protein